MFGVVPLTTAAPLVTPPQPAPFSVGGTILGAIQAYGSGGPMGATAALNVALGAVSTAVPAVGVALGVASALGLDIGSLIQTSSKANWNRSLGRVYRAALLGYVPPTAGAESIIGRIKAAWINAGDTTGAQFWDRVVQVFGIPTTKGGTKEGFGSGAPAGEKTAEAQPGFKSGLLRFLSAVG
jgi:hypothetical protein